MALLALPLAASPQEPPTPLTPSPALSGCTGLVRIPSAEVLPYGQYALGVNALSREYRPYLRGGDTVAHFVTVGVFPRVEVSAVFTNHDGRLGAQHYEDLGTGVGGWNIDRMLSVQAVLLPQTAARPVSVAAGWQDIAGTGAFRTRYLVATHRRPTYGLHLGVGDGILGPVFAGVDAQATPQIRAMLEYDGAHANLGVEARLGHFRVTPVLSGLKSLGGGITYCQSL
ncbi:MAG: YjbH domain-containing protein [Armatimonadetes bacterium]|nr:YjbH domain-containing protein [Armatimonadota bacterium]